MLFSVVYRYNNASTHSVNFHLLPLQDHEVADLKRLGLTPKHSVKVDTELGTRVIKGRFLHISDIHPDPYYKAGSSIDKMCHKGTGKASKYGDAILGCDSPMELMYDTLDWIKHNLKDKIDFVVWTGDNVRHDNDRNYPRSEMHIFDMNEKVSDTLYDIFRNNDSSDPRLMDVDLVPSLGNNDVYPHNLYAPGPTLQTREMYRIWKNFIPESQLHLFNRGAYYFQEVIPNQLAVLSINTLYLFQSNPLVDNCDSRKQSGYKLFEWLGYVLKEMRARNMKVWLSGHVPPNEKNYDISCLRKYILWSHEYRDVIIGGLFGHMNIDHFIPLDSVAAYKSVQNEFGDIFERDIATEFLNDEYDSDSDDDDEVDALGSSDYWHVFNQKYDKDFMRVKGGVPQNKVRYMSSLRETLYAKIKGKKKSGMYSERYAIANVAASIIPTFNPGLRVYEYNITELHNTPAIKFAPWTQFFNGLNKLFEDDDHEDGVENESKDIEVLKKDKTFPPKMPKNLSPGPGYIPQTFTPERYVQYYLDLENVNSGEKPFEYEIEYSTDDKLIGMKSLVVDEWIKYGRSLAKPIKKSKKKKNKKNKKKKGKNSSGDENYIADVWNNYLKNSFVSSGYENRGYG